MIENNHFPKCLKINRQKPNAANPQNCVIREMLNVGFGQQTNIFIFCPPESSGSVSDFFFLPILAAL